MLQSYLALEFFLKNYAGKAGLEAKEAGRAAFLLSQSANAVAPTNFLLGNPQALKRAGRDKRQEPAGRLPEFPRRRYEADPFRHRSTAVVQVGENLAVTPGHVVLRTRCSSAAVFAANGGSPAAAYLGHSVDYQQILRLRPRAGRSLV